MSYIVDFSKVSTVGLASSPVAEALAGLRANEARYFMNKYQHTFTVVPVNESQETLDYVRNPPTSTRQGEVAGEFIITSILLTSKIQRSACGIPPHSEIQSLVFRHADPQD